MSPTLVAPSVGTSNQAYRFIDPSVLARIGNLELVARTVVEGFINGLHRAPHLGASMDFAEHRAYMPGDDIRRIDWKLFARSDRFYVKEFEADTNTNFVVMLDVSKSMRYGGPGATGAAVSKLEYASFLTACLAYFSGLQRDRVGLVTFDTEIRGFIPPSAKRLQEILHTLDRLSREKGGELEGMERRATWEAKEASGNGAGHATLSAPTAARVPLREITRQLAETFRRRCIVALVSDLYEEPEEIVDALSYLRGKGNDLIVFHVLDKSELDFPFSDPASFMDLETGARMPLIPDYLRKQYKELIAQHTRTLGTKLGEGRTDYALFDTSKPLDHALFSYLALRERLSRVR
jgi:uncharacterized protein (DUF58 family)